MDRFRGAGVYHAAMATDAERCRDEDVVVVGGGNSAGQAAVHLASRARSVRIVVRGKALKSTMSHYLVDRIERSPRIEVMTETEVAAVHGTATVESVSLRERRRRRQAGAVDRRVRDDRRRPVHRGDDGDARGRRRRLPAVRHRRRRSATGTSAGRCRTASRISSRRSARACSPPATCAPERRSAWRARSATARWSCASHTTCSPAESGYSSAPMRADRWSSWGFTRRRTALTTTKRVTPMTAPANPSRPNRSAPSPAPTRTASAFCTSGQKPSPNGRKIRGRLEPLVCTSLFTNGTSRCRVSSDLRLPGQRRSNRGGKPPWLWRAPELKNRHAAPRRMSSAIASAAGTARRFGHSLMMWMSFSPVSALTRTVAIPILPVRT